MKVAVGLIEGHAAVAAELIGGRFLDASGKSYPPGRYRFTAEISLTPSDPAACAFALDEVTIGIGFHWQRRERQLFHGALRILSRPPGLVVINDVALEEYVTSVISSEMSASCPPELLKAHAVISRSWLCFKAYRPDAGARRALRDSHEIVRWYGREAHRDFDVCADDHCQRYQGVTKAFSPAAAQAVEATAGEFLRYQGVICDARFSKCCGGITERYSSAWADEDVPYLAPVADGAAPLSAHTAESWIRSKPPAWCNTDDRELLSRVLPGIDQETCDFYRWRVRYTGEELGELVRSRLAVDLGPICALEALSRGPSGRIYRLKIGGERGYVIIGKELEIRRVLSRTHLYSSAFVVDREPAGFVLTGAGWGHGVGLCQIGAAVMATQGKSYREILQHYYRQTAVSA